MAEAKRPTLWERISQTALLGGVLAGLRIAAVSLFTIGTADFLTAGVVVGAGVGGVIYLLDKISHAISPSKG
jgi:hypothetical protein